MAWEHYHDHAGKGEAANEMMQSSLSGGMMRELTGEANLDPGMPTATEYSLIFAVLAGIGGVVCLVVVAKKAPGSIPPPTPRTP